MVHKETVPVSLLLAIHVVVVDGELEARVGLFDLG